MKLIFTYLVMSINKTVGFGVAKILKLCMKGLCTARGHNVCAVTCSCVFVPYFFEDENGAAVTVAAERYNHMLNTFFFPELQRLNLKDMWMQ